MPPGRPGGGGGLEDSDITRFWRIQPLRVSRRIRTLHSLGGFNNRGFDVLEDSPGSGSGPKCSQGHGVVFGIELHSRWG